jgi:hypothetical protein
LNDLNESLLYKETIDYDSFKYLVEPLFNTPTLERRTAPSFGTWLTGAQYIVTQMERVYMIELFLMIEILLFFVFYSLV